MAGGHARRRPLRPDRARRARRPVRLHRRHAEQRELRHGQRVAVRVAGRQRRRPSRPTRRRPASPSRRSRAPRCRTSTIPPWDGKERLNILLIGTDQRPKEGTYNTDTLIVVSIDPVTKQVAMFSLPRDTVDIPLPPGPLRNAYSGGVYPKKINTLFTAVRNRRRPRSRATSRTRGYNGLKEVLGYALRARHQVLRRGQLRRLQAGRRRAGRGDDQRPDPGQRRELPVPTRAASPGSTSRPASST